MAVIYGVDQNLAGGHWQISRVGLAMHLDGDEEGLLVYPAGPANGAAGGPTVRGDPHRTVGGWGLTMATTFESAVRKRPTARWLFEDRSTGALVFGQTPNALGWIFLGSLAARLVTRPGTARTSAGLVCAGSLALWAADEGIRGVNPFRRIGGALVLATVPFGRLVRGRR